MSVDTETSSSSSRRVSHDGPVIVVGYDGSEESRLAVAVAAQRAGPTGTVVPTHVTVTDSNWLDSDFHEPAIEATYAAAQAVLAEMEALDVGDAANEPELTDGEPVEALLSVARALDADEIVVGSRGLGKIRALMGSVSRALIERADRPVVVVPRRAVSDA